MKCLLNPTTGEVRRVDLPKAIQLRADGWTYCTKTLWRTYRNREAPSMSMQLRRPNALEVKAERGVASCLNQIGAASV